MVYLEILNSWHHHHMPDLGLTCTRLQMKDSPTEGDAQTEHDVHFTLGWTSMHATTAADDRVSPSSSLTRYLRAQAQSGPVRGLIQTAAGGYYTSRCGDFSLVSSRMSLTLCA